MENTLPRVHSHGCINPILYYSCLFFLCFVSPGFVDKINRSISQRNKSCPSMDETFVTKDNLDSTLITIRTPYPPFHILNPLIIPLGFPWDSVITCQEALCAIDDAELTNAIYIIWCQLFFFKFNLSESASQRYMQN